MTDRRLWLIADDYSLSPGVSEAILHLLVQGRLSGTGCMTLFPEWPEAARQLREAPLGAAIGLHLTLTDQMALSGRSVLAPEGRLPSLGQLLLRTTGNRQVAHAVIRELDLQYQSFVEAMGRAPDFVDGHQHVHFLPVVRRWFADLAQRAAPHPVPFVRGAPALAYASNAVLAKTAFVRGMARGFDRSLRSAGLHVAGPLAGFYDWHDGRAFAASLERGAAALPDDSIFMCHPGNVDALLESRDGLRAPRIIEFEYLRSRSFAEALERSGAAIATLER